MSKPKNTQRYDNGKVKLFFIPLDIATIDTAFPALTDEEIGELVRALWEYEKSAAEVMPDIKGGGRIIQGACQKNMEQAREKLNRQSIINTEKINKRYGKKSKELEPIE